MRKAETQFVPSNTLITLPEPLKPISERKLREDYICIKDMYVLQE